MTTFPEITLLRKEKTKAIKSCNVKLARVLDNEIKRLQNQRDSIQSETNLLINKAKFNIAHENIQREVDEIQFQTIQKEFRLRMKFQERIQSLQISQYEELENLSQTFINNIDSVTKKPYAGAKNLIEAAKKVASIGEFERAQELYRQSKEVSSKYYGTQVEMYSERYANDIMNMTTRHSNQLEICFNKMNEEIDALYRQYETQILLKQKQLDNIAKKLGIQEVIDIRPKEYNQPILDTPRKLQDHLSNSGLLSRSVIDDISYHD